MMTADPHSTSPETAAPRRSLLERAAAPLLALLFLAGLAGLAGTTGWDEVAAQVGRLGPWQIALLLMLSLANYALRGLRWHLFAHHLGLPTGPWQDLRHFLGGFAMVITPGRVGELVRMRWLKRETGWAYERTAPLALLDRAADLAAMAILLGLSAALASSALAGAVPVTLLALAAAFLATRPRLVAGAVTLMHRATGRMPRLFARLRAAARSLDRVAGWRVMLPALGFGMAGWLAEGYALHLLLGWMGAEIGLGKAMAVFVFATIAGNLTGAPGGLGGAEAAMIALLALDGVPMEISIPATAIIRVTTLWFALGIGLVIFPFAERLSLRGRHGLENR